MKINTAQKGFTILELLIAIAIIALLASATITMYDNAKVKSRDSKRSADMVDLRNGLDLYFIDNSLYPVIPSGITLTGTDALSTTLINAGHMAGVPTDPSPLYDYVYTSNSSGTNYEISFCMEGDSLRDYVQGCGNTISP